MKITPLTRVIYQGKNQTVADLAKVLAKDWKINREEPHKYVMMAVNLQYKEGYSLPEDVPAKDVTTLKKMAAKFKEIVEASEAEKAKLKAAEEKAAAEAEKRKKSMELAMTKATKAADNAVAKLDQKIDISSYVGDAFKIEDGALVATKDNISNEEFAKAFSGLESMINLSLKLTSSLATLEAQLAVMAKKQVGDEWVNFFSSDPTKVKMIKQNMKALERAESLGVTLRTDQGEIPVGIARALLESKISSGSDDSDKLNDEFRKEILEEYIEKSNAKGQRLTANEARQLVAEKKKAKGGQGKIQYNHFYVFVYTGKEGPAIKVLPSLENQINVKNLEKCALCMDRALNVYTLEKDGSITRKPVEPPSEKILEKLAAQGIDTSVVYKKEAVPAKDEAPPADDAGKKGKKGKNGKPAKEEPAKEEEEEEEDGLSFGEEEEKEESIVDDADTAEGEEEEEEEEDEDGDDDFSFEE